MNRSTFFKSLLTTLAVMFGFKTEAKQHVKTVRLHGPEKLHVDDLYPIDPNLPKREGSYVCDNGRYYIWQNGKWCSYWEVKGHMHRL